MGVSAFSLTRRFIVPQKEVESVDSRPHAAAFCVLFQAISLIDFFHQGSQQFSCAQMLHLTVEKSKNKIVIMPKWRTQPSSVPQGGK